MEKYWCFSFFQVFRFLQLFWFWLQKKLKKLKKPHLAGKYILWRNIGFSVFFSFFGFCNCLGFGYSKKIEEPEKTLKKTYLAGRYILWKSMENIVFFRFFVFSGVLVFAFKRLEKPEKQN